MDSEESEVEKTMSSLFPMFLKLEGKRCLVVGAGKVGEPKIGGLHRHGRAHPCDCFAGK